MLPGALRGKHRRLQEQLSAYLDDELLPSDRLEIERHLDECTSCRAELEELRTVAWAISQLRVARSPKAFGLEPSLFATPVPVVGGSGSRVASRSRSVLYVAAWAAAGLAALALGAGAARFLTRIGEPGTTQTITSSNAPPPSTPSPTSTPALTTTASATPTATASATPAPTASVAVASNAPAAPPRPAPAVVGGNSQPGGAVVISVPQRPGPAPVSATNAPQPTATLASGVVAAPSTLANPGQLPATPTPTPGPLTASGQPVPQTAGAPPPPPSLSSVSGGVRTPAVTSPAFGASSPTTAAPGPGVISAGPGQGVSGPAPTIGGSAPVGAGAASTYTGAGTTAAPNTGANVLVPPLNPGPGTAARPVQTPSSFPVASP